MIVTRTPFRISFCGGGTDLPSYFLENGGCVLSTSIDKYVYISINPSFDRSRTVLKYSKVEDVKNLDSINHSIFRETLKRYSVAGVEINSTSDIPSGTGMGSSSSFTVGLLNALRTYKGVPSSKEDLASEACEMEIDVLKGDIGYQDQYAAAYGGLNFIEFGKDGRTTVTPVSMSEEDMGRLSDNLLLFYLGGTRDASEVIHSYSSNAGAMLDKKQKLKDLAYRLRERFEKGDIDALGPILDEGWKVKKSLSGSVSSSIIDSAYETAMENGATGGKLLGAGGSGFLLVYAGEGERDAVRSAMSRYREMPFGLDCEGSKVVYSGKHR